MVMAHKSTLYSRPNRHRAPRATPRTSPSRTTPSSNTHPTGSCATNKLRRGRASSQDHVERPPKHENAHDPRVEWTCVPFRPFLLVQRLKDGVARPSCAHALRRQWLALCVAVFHAPPRHPLAQSRSRRVRRASGIPPPRSDPRSSLGCRPSIFFLRTWTRARHETHPCPRRNQILCTSSGCSTRWMSLAFAGSFTADPLVLSQHQHSHPHTPTASSGAPRRPWHRAHALSPPHADPNADREDDVPANDALHRVAGYR